MSKISELSAPLASFALKRPVTVCMFFLSFLILGLVSSRMLPLEKFPGIDIPQIVVNVPYRSSTPAEVERLITRPLEEALATLPGIQEMRSNSAENGADVVLNFAWKDSVSARSIEARERVESMRHLLPDDVERVFIFQFNTEDMPVMQLRISSQQDLSLAWELLNRQLKQPLERVEGISRVGLYGVQQREIMLRLNPEALSATGLSVNAITARLNEANFTMSAGYLETDYDRILVKPAGEYRNLDDIRTLPITPDLSLGDIAEVNYELPRATDGRSFNQSFAIGVDIYKESSANLVDVARAASQLIDEVSNSPEFSGINLMMMDNTAESVTTSLSDLLKAGGFGALLSIVVLYLFLRDWRTTLIIVVSVPIAICLTLGVMYLLGYSLNILSMMGLMLAIGMLIDNAVVVTESIQQEQQATGKVQDKATVIAGTSRVSLAIIAGTLTTAIVFLPNIFGETDQITIFLEHVAIAICISLLASLLIAQTLIPMLLSKIKLNISAEPPKAGIIKRGYLHSLRWSHRHPRLTTLFTLLIMASTVVPFSNVGSDETDVAYNDRLFINYHITGQYKLEEVEREVTALESYLYANKEALELEHVYSYYTPGYAMSTLLLKPDRTLSVAEIQQRVRDNMPPLPRSEPVFGFRGGDNNGVQITLQGRSTQELENIADSLIPMLSRIDGLADVQTDDNNAKNELRIHIDREQAERFGLNSAQVAEQIGVALRGSNLRSFRHNPEGDMRIRVMFPEYFSQSLAELEQMVVARVGNTLINLNQIARIEEVEQLGNIRRFDRQTAVRINANLNDMTMAEARTAINQVMANVQLPDGYRWSLDGGFRAQQRQNSIMLVNMLLAVAMVYMVMAALFESLLLPSAVIGSLILAITGVFWGLWLTGNGIEMMALIGMLILMGIVVNNGIVLVDAINQLVDEGYVLENAILEAASRRVRPILMTVATTILGMVPLALGSTQIGGDGPPYTPMAITIISGLAFSTLTSLYFVPHAYSRLLYWRSHWGKVWERSGRPLRRQKQPANQHSR
ncbi:AcrB/AcrD/AcrF family protein [Aliidiomarina iranensis]|uniref:AcrB/AcrD/AcrF family protein n=1 Tax=Aliidiomarina iranensis TaxID=1434071 RepID=A0A432VQK5_9GAMM|nr:efflux RND transporter permease subunit [Aliidiomarina iranensis]RUO18489.1 AcrB/AcrD/AcrF family protein [Aliidiomarina iranensis]